MVLDRRRKNNLVGHGEPRERYDDPGQCFGADGAAALYRREALLDCAAGGEGLSHAPREAMLHRAPGLAPLDEALEKYAADVDLAWRAQLRGWRCAYEPRAVAHHVRTYGPSTRAQVSEQARRMQFRNRYLMIAKNETGPGLARDLAWIASYEALALGHVLLRERHLLGGYRDAGALLRGAWRRRGLVQSRRSVGIPPFGLRPRR